MPKLREQRAMTDAEPNGTVHPRYFHLRPRTVRQSSKYTGQNAHEEKKGILAMPEVRARKWQQAEVRVGYFLLRRWVPKDQHHLTAELHGGETDALAKVTNCPPNLSLF
ncbi:unnamed protein product [Choristocarpus tenellus]